MSKKILQQIEKFNITYKVGDKVIVLNDLKKEFEDTIRRPATLMGGHTAMAWLENKGSYMLERVIRKVYPLGIRRKTMKEPTEENRMIAEFMGYKIYKNDAYMLPASMSHITENQVLEYDEHWAYLIPVCKKLNLDVISTDIEKAYRTVIEFIKLKRIN